MRLPAMRALGGIPQQHVVVFGEDDVIGDDVQVGDCGHYFGVRVGVVEGGVAVWEGGGGGESAGGGAEVGDGGAAFVVGGGVGG